MMIQRESAEAPIVAESVEAPIEENRRSTSAVVPTSSAVVPTSSAVVPTSSAVVSTSSGSAIDSNFKIEYIPSRLAFSLLKSFDEEKCKIKLYNVKKFHITEEDMELVYGFPRGDIIYCREKWKSNAPFMRELAEQCDTKPGNVNHKAVELLMLADHEGGPQFKRLFLVLLESALIEPSTCGMIKSKIGEIIDDLDNVRNIN
ncbi:hypothetical protein SASPL_155578 [Salvia splendens]|uniref:Uncharacterized protein n=1 Tax=Salvia splendens TaxID=180675 RepID=A0A8X8VY57_SALSN|nr:hypothetical protein SASPL_155578 [Salvia splendens]